MKRSSQASNRKKEAIRNQNFLSCRTPISKEIVADIISSTPDIQVPTELSPAMTNRG